MEICVYTHEKAQWCLKPLAYLFNVYWSELQPVYIAGGEPSVDLPENFYWLQVESRVKERWSDGLIDMLKIIKSDVICLLLEDYWLVRFVDWEVINSLEEYMLNNPDILRIDLTADRLYSGRAVDIDYWGRCDILKTDWDTPYQWSTQAGLWNRHHLLANLRPELSPWDFELQDNDQKHLRVLGTRQWPVRYINGVGMQLDEKYRYRTEHVREGLGGKTIERIDKEHVDVMIRRGILPPRAK